MRITHVKNATRGMLVVPLLLLGVQQAVGVELANFQVVQNDFGNSATSVTFTIPTGQSTAGAAVRDGSNAGDYNLDFSASQSGSKDDVANGVMLPFVTQNFSKHFDKAGIPLYGVGTASAAKSLLNNGTPEDTADDYEQYFIAVAASNSGIELNTNVSAAYFPFSEGWITGAANNTANGGVFTSINAGIISSTGSNIVTLNGSPTSTTGTLFGGTNGQHQLFLPTSLNADTRTDGLLFVTHAKNEDNYALSHPSATGDSFHIITRDNGSNGTTTEQDPVAFVYVPFGQTNAVGTPIAMGKVNGDGTFVTVNDGISNTTLVQGGATISTSIDGLYSLTIPGQDPSTGVLMVSPESSLDNTAASFDNFVTYQPNLSGGWDIAVRDIGLRQAQLESVGAIPAFSFAFMPFANAPTGPTYGNLSGSIGSISTNVPEPTSLVLLGVPAALALWTRRRSGV